MPLVSVVMATHRPTPFLRAAVDSVLGQSLGDLELLLVDNGAGLDRDMLGTTGNDTRLHLIRFEGNRGIPAAHNAAVEAARGDFLALLDHDDVMLPRRLERQVAALRADPLLGLVSCLAETIDDEGRAKGREFALVSAEDQRRYSLYSTPVVSPAYAGRREVFADLPYRESFPLTGDFDFLSRAAERVRMSAVPEVLLRYRRHAGQTTVEHAALIEWQRVGVRLETARRRAGREPRPLAALPAPADAAEASLHGAGLALAEGFHELAAYQARRALALRRTPGMAWEAAIRGLQAIRAAESGGRRRVGMMFLAGPVRALGLRPA